ncbi:MAG: ABC transporter substrate-binding protein [Erythrobacter sp.]
MPLLLAIVVAGCDVTGADGPVEVAIIGESDELFQNGLRLATSAQHLRAATHEGLVSLDPTGQAIPAIAERWIITDDGKSYIFRLRDMQWPDGDNITAQQVRRLLLDKQRRLAGTSLGLDLAKVAEVRAMTGRVIEVQLTAAMPEFLRLLAQPEMGFSRSGAGTGPMTISRSEGLPVAQLTALPPERRGFAAREDWQELAREIRVEAVSAASAVDAFGDGEVDLVLNGRLAHLPMADTGPLTRGTVRIDAAWGQFGLTFRRESDLFANVAVREALSMAIDRSDLMQSFNIGGWVPSNEIVPRELWGDVEPQALEWADWPIERRHAEASRRVAAWSAESGEAAQVTIGMPEGPGSERLFEEIAADFSAIGVEATLAEAGRGADLELHDRVARYASARWYLNQFNCEIRTGPCSPAADELVAQSLLVNEPAEKEDLLAQAELELTDAHVFIAFGAPIRWSLVRSNVTGYQENRWGLHPLFPLSQPTN